MRLGGLQQEEIQPEPSSNAGSNDEEEDLVLEQAEEHAYPLVDGETMNAPLPFAEPSKPEYRDPLTGRVAFVASSRHGMLHNDDRVTFYAQGITGLFHQRAYFVAQRHWRGGYAIFNVYNDNSPATLQKHFSTADPRYVGKLKRVGTHHGHVRYILLRKQTGTTVPVSTTIYKTASLSYPVVNGCPDRIAYSVLHKNDNQPRSLATKARDHEDFHKHVEDHPEDTLFQSKRRFTDPQGRKLYLDVQSFRQKFGGRSLLSSKKNMQLMNVSSGKTILQMGRQHHWQEGDFSVDFLPPYTPFVAFGFCLAQLAVH
ncbi:expressed unknown protein [Seminavis robusta]|uniref:Tubby C-terminal domain-containing protein n=1 Tax=Seminavis robusta TaxID=568900 RepID=A0A9N8DVJ8_9STRA|nr:expressed unknown protein [Seminavis robusta]|eukprot:Sro307_g113410.1 n/a (313) ;mRNA; f:62609-63547